jgi:hypothetical protein
MEKTTKKLKKEVFDLLSREDFETSLGKIEHFPLKQTVGPLFSFFYNKDDLVRWRAVTAMGAVVAKMAETQVESARVVMRRLMWNLNDESGGIGWGSPEAMGEILARSPRLADEFRNILVSYIREDGNYLEYDMLQRGAVWGVGRLARSRPEIMADCPPHLAPYMFSEDAHLRGIAAWAVGPLDIAPAKSRLLELLEDHSTIQIFIDLELVERKVSRLAAESLKIKH